MGSLDGLKILDFSTLLPGPYASLMLADMGAEVLKISAPDRYDLVLGMDPVIEGTDITATQAWLGRNKKTMLLDLKRPEGKEIVKQLILEYDIILEQFRPGVMDRLGLGYETLKEINPALIYCALTGYGQTGPMAGAAGHDINYMSRSGIISHAGRKSGGPSLMDFQVADIAVGSLNSVVGILAAVNYRHTTGKGQFVDISMMDGCVPFNSLSGANFLVSGTQPGREDQLLNGGSMYDYYETRDGEYMSVGALEPKFWAEFCKAMGCEDLIGLTSSPADLEPVKSRIRDLFKTKTKDEWTEIFSGFDACVEPVLNLKEALICDEQIKAREMVVDVDLPLHDGMKVKQMGTAIKLSECPCEYKYAGYPLGYHTKEIVEGLGLDYENLKAKGVLK
ncbi:MAG: CaiB/BaiF CoA-transferase family protein [Bacillota bacterium]|nr:CaiB/BaiF CoA-transferase family protein [Bacillota bacterium]